MSLGRANPVFDPSVTNVVETARGGAGYIVMWEFQNPGGADAYIQLFDAKAADVTLGTTTPTLSLLVPGSGANDKAFAVPFYFKSGVCYAATTTPTGSTAPGTALILNMGVA